MGLADFVRVYRFLRGIRYPATKQQLMDQARNNQADEEALSSLGEMPEGEYSSPDAVSRVIAEKGGRAEPSAKPPAPTASTTSVRSAGLNRLKTRNSPER